MTITYTNGLSAAKLYSAIFGEPASQSVVDSYENGKSSSTTVAKAMWADAAQGTGYASYNYDNNTVLVYEIYMNVLGRTEAEIAADAGVQWWVDQFDQGTYTADEAVVAILGGINPANDPYGDQAYVDAKLTEGADFNLEITKDDISGTANDDTFYAEVQQNQNGSIVNALATGDVIDGSTGDDELIATVLNDNEVDDTADNVAINMSTTSIEKVSLSVIEEDVTIDAGDMDSVEEFWSDDSEGNLTIKDVRLGSELVVTQEITFGMKDVDFDSGLTATIDSLSFENEGATTTNSKILIEVGDSNKAADSTDPLELIKLSLNFTHNSTDYVLTDIISTDGTYAGLKTAIETELTAQGLTTLTVDFGDDLDEIIATNDTVPLLYADAKQIIITDPAGNAFTNFLSGVAAAVSNQSSNPVSNTDVVAPALNTTYVETNLILDNAGRGSTAGDVNIDAMSNSDEGIEKFNVMVDRDSAIASLSTTNDKLTEVEITSLTNEGDLEIGELDAGITLIDASAFAGDNLMLGQTVEDNGADVTNLTTLSANISADVRFDAALTSTASADYAYTTGSGSDTINVSIDGNAVDADGESFSLTTGSNDDTVTVTMDATQDGVSFDTMDELANMSISTDAGNDSININAYGTFEIEAGDGDDIVVIDSTDENGNATTINYTFGDASGAQSWGSTAQERVLYEAELTITYAGYESTVTIDTDSSGNFKADQITINNAVKEAIDESEILSKLLSYTDGTGDQVLTVTSVHGGLNNLSVDIFQPELVATSGAVVAGQSVQLVAADESALRTGILETKAFDAQVNALDSNDFEDGTEIIAEFNTGANNFTGSISTTGQGNGDVDYELELNETETQGSDLSTAGAYNFEEGFALGANSTTDTNISTINLGDDTNIAVLHSAAVSANTIVIDESFETNYVVNFHDVSADDVDVDKDNVGEHAVDFSAYLTDTVDASSDIANNSDSEESITVTLHDDDNTFTSNATASNDDNVVANGINVLHYDEDTADSVAFDTFTAAQLKDALNESGTSTTVIGGLDDTTLDIESNITANQTDTTQNHILMVQNEQNLGEYRVFHATSTLDSAKTAMDGDDDFATITDLGTLDFGMSINFNAVGSTAWNTFKADIIDAVDNGNTVDLDGVATAITTTGSLAAAAAAANLTVSAASTLSTSNATPDVFTLTVDATGLTSTYTETSTGGARILVEAGNALTYGSTAHTNTATIELADSTASVTSSLTNINGDKVTVVAATDADADLTISAPDTHAITAVDLSNVSTEGTTTLNMADTAGDTTFTADFTGNLNVTTTANAINLTNVIGDVEISGLTAAKTITTNDSDNGTVTIIGVANELTLAGDSAISITTTDDATADLVGGSYTGDITITNAANTNATNFATGSGDDTITLGTGGDTIAAGAGDDTITGDSGDTDDTITGGTGSDTIVSTNAADSDVFIIAAGDSDFTTGIDLYSDAIFNAATNDTFQITGLNGTETIEASQASGLASTGLSVTALNTLINSTNGTLGQTLDGDSTHTQAMILTTTDSKAYLVFDIDANGVFADGSDAIVEITGSTQTSMTEAIFA